MSKVSTESPHRGQPSVGQQRQQADTRRPEQTVPETKSLVNIIKICFLMTKIVTESGKKAVEDEANGSISVLKNWESSVDQRFTDLEYN